jgi:hypothetical protein
MFRRILLDHWMSIFPLVSFVVAASIYGWISVKAIRMRGEQVDRFALLPFNEDLPPSHHESKV